MKDIQIIIPEKVHAIIEVLKENGYEAYIVGGCVRDAILGKEPDDWDITTSALPETVIQLFPRIVETGLKHGTVTVFMGKEGFEVTTYRIDGEYLDNRHPKEVLFTSKLKEDLRRRDFTINAMAYNDGEGLVDVFGGISDLKQKVIRCVGDPQERFNEDALRILRAVRFAAGLGFEIEQNTKIAMKKLAGNLSAISYERIQAELVKLLISENPSKLETAYELGITREILPEFDAMMNCTYVNGEKGIISVGAHTLQSLQLIEGEKSLRLAILCHEMGKPGRKEIDKEGYSKFPGYEELGAHLTKSILRRLRFDNDTLNKVTRLVKWHNIEIPTTKTDVRRAIFQVGEDLFEDLLKVKQALLLASLSSSKEESEDLKKLSQIYMIYKEILESKDCVSLRTLKISGKDIIAQGLKPGVEVGELLNQLLEQVIENPEYNNKDYLILEVRNYIKNYIKNKQ